MNLLRWLYSPFVSLVEWFRAPSTRSSAPGGVLSTSAEALEWVDESENPTSHHRLLWSDVRAILAWKVDLYTTDLVCVGFDTGADAPATVHEEMVGWTDLLAELERRYGVTQDWVLDVTFPPFAENLTLLCSWKHPPARSAGGVKGARKASGAQREPSTPPSTGRRSEITERGHGFPPP